MKLNLILLTLLQRALCVQQAVDPAELHSDLQSAHLDAWIEKIAAKRQIPKDAVRSNVRAVTYHLDSLTKDPGSAGGGNPKLKRKLRKPTKDYPEYYRKEDQNDQLTRNRIEHYNGMCRRANLQPENSPFTPNNHVWSFWRSFQGNCRDDNQVVLYCRLPNEFGPRGWQEDTPATLRETVFSCAKGEQCATFMAHNFLQDQPVMYSGCTTPKTTQQRQGVNGVRVYFDYFMCPITPYFGTEWDVYAQTTDGKPVEWTLFTGIDTDPLFSSQGLQYESARPVKWSVNNPQKQPWLRFARKGETAAVRVYSHLLVNPPPK